MEIGNVQKVLFRFWKHLVMPTSNFTYLFKSFTNQKNKTKQTKKQTNKKTDYGLIYSPQLLTVSNNQIKSWLKTEVHPKAMKNIVVD